MKRLTIPSRTIPFSSRIPTMLTRITLIATLLPILIPKTHGNFNLFMDSKEVKRILGLSKELFYVREGVPNTYALNFVVPIQRNVSALKFNWESLLIPEEGKGGKEELLQYSFNLTSSDPAVILPSLSIPASGLLPSDPQTFQVFLPCSGEKSAEVLINVGLNVTLISTARPEKLGNIGLQETISITLKRRKVCLAGSPDEITITRLITSSTEKPGRTKSPGRKGKGKLGGVQNKTESYLPKPVEELQKEGILLAILAAGFLIFLIFLAVIFTRRRFLQEREGKVARSDSTASTSMTSTTTKSTTTLNLHLPDGESEDHLYAYSSCDQQGYYNYTKSFGRKREGEFGDPEYEAVKVTRIIPRHKIRLQTLLLEGSFGRLYKASLQVGHGGGPGFGYEKSVLVKTVLDSAPSVQRARFLQDGLVLMSQAHPNLLPVMAVTEESCSPSQLPPFLIYESSGAEWNMRKYLEHHLRNEVPLGRGKLIQFSVDIASALSYLHSRGVAHGDVSTRNAIVSLTKDTALLMDSSLACDFFQEDFDIMTKLPVRWSPPEFLAHYDEGQRATISGDIWSLGIFIWEMFNLGRTPFEDVPLAELSAELRKGLRPNCPANFPVSLFQTLQDICWGFEESERGSVGEVLHLLELLLISHTREEESLLRSGGNYYYSYQCIV